MPTRVTLSIAASTPPPPARILPCGPSTTARVGTGAASKYFPAGAQWDNLAITEASAFVAPAPIGSETNIHPVVAITSPPDGTNIVSPDTPVTLQLIASASDSDGTVTKVEFYADATKLGETAVSPYTVPWTIPASGSYQLTAVGDR